MGQLEDERSHATRAAVDKDCLTVTKGPMDFTLGRTSVIPETTISRGSLLTPPGSLYHRLFHGPNMQQEDR